ncbi:MAG: GNAT family N-acetyltransferase [Clostridia bacterium]
MIRSATSADNAVIERLWSICFTDDDEFLKLFFKRMYAPESALVYEENGEICAMLHIFTYDIALCGAPDVTAKYIYGVGCHPAFRGRGFAGALLRHALDCAGHAAFCMMVPEDDGLREYYKRFGFTHMLSLKKTRAEASALPCKLCTADAKTLNLIYEHAFGNYVHPRRTPHEWGTLIRDEHILASARAYAVMGQNCIKEVAAMDEQSYAEIIGAAGGGAACVYVPGDGTPYASVCITQEGFQMPKAAYFNLLHD